MSPNQILKPLISSVVILAQLVSLSVALPAELVRHFFGNILGLGVYFSKPIFGLKPWVQADRFEYHKLYNRNNFFRTYKGALANLRGLNCKNIPKLQRFYHFKKVYFLISVRYGTPVPHIYESAKYYCMLLHHFFFCFYLGEKLSGLMGIVD